MANTIATRVNMASLKRLAAQVKFNQFSDSLMPAERARLREKFGTEEHFWLLQQPIKIELLPSRKPFVVV